MTHHFVMVQNCPVPVRLAPFLRTILAESGAVLNSAYRGEDVAALLHSVGKHTQKELWLGWENRLPGFLPANPPGFSTHELKNDGRAYSRRHPGGTHAGQWYRGDDLPWWACGLDINDDDVSEFLRVSHRHGFVANRTYPSSHAEAHHINFRKPPVWIRISSLVRSKEVV